MNELMEKEHNNNNNNIGYYDCRVPLNSGPNCRGDLMHLDQLSRGNRMSSLDESVIKTLETEYYIFQMLQMS